MSSSISERKKAAIQVLDVCKIPYEKVISVGSYGSIFLVKAVGEGDGGVKVLKVALTTNSYAGIRYPSEIDALRRLAHPNIIRAERIVTQRDCKDLVGYAMLMEYAPITLRDFTDSNPEERLKDMVAKQILSAVNHAHKCGILHLDISRGNIVIKGEKSPTGEIRDVGAYPNACLVDFGMSINVEDTTIPFEIQHEAVTVDFRPPELIKFRIDEKAFGPIGVTYATDIWSTGVIIGRIYGSHIEYSERLKDFYKEIITSVTPGGGFFTSLEHKRDPKGLVDLLSKMMDLDPEKRITAEEALNHSFFRSVSTSSDKKAPYYSTGVSTYLDLSSIRTISKPQSRLGYLTPPPIDQKTVTNLLKRVRSVGSSYPHDLTGTLFNAIDLAMLCSDMYSDKSIDRGVRREIPSACYWIAQKLKYKRTLASIFADGSSRIQNLIDAELLIFERTTGATGRNYVHVLCQTLDDEKFMLDWIITNPELYFLIDLRGLKSLMGMGSGKRGQRHMIGDLVDFESYDPEVRD